MSVVVPVLHWQASWPRARGVGAEHTETLQVVRRGDHGDDVHRPRGETAEVWRPRTKTRSDFRRGPEKLDVSCSLRRGMASSAMRHTEVDPGTNAITADVVDAAIKVHRN